MKVFLPLTEDSFNSFPTGELEIHATNGGKEVRFSLTDDTREFSVNLQDLKKVLGIL